jgi:polysaccharide biosynthesis/export protein
VPDDYLEWTSRVFDTVATDTLGEGDRFTVSVAFHDELANAYVVPSTGSVAFPFIGEVVVAGRTCGEVSADVAARLADGYLREPTVRCEIEELNSLQVVVSGEVQGPGVFPYSNRLTIVEVIAAAQGMTREAAKDRVLVTRLVDGEQVEILVPFQQVLNGRAPSLPLWPGDRVFVPTFRLIP